MPNGDGHGNQILIAGACVAEPRCREEYIWEIEKVGQ